MSYLGQRLDFGLASDSTLCQSLVHSNDLVPSPFIASSSPLVTFAISVQSVSCNNRRIYQLNQNLQVFFNSIQYFIKHKQNILLKAELFLLFALLFTFVLNPFFAKWSTKTWLKANAIQKSWKKVPVIGHNFLYINMIGAYSPNIGVN